MDSFHYFQIFENGTRAARVRGMESGFQFTSSTNQIKLTFTSDDNVNFEGFRGTFQGGLLLLSKFFLCM